MEELGPQARAATPAGAAAAGDLVVVSIPPRAYPAVPVEPLAGKPVLDTINYILQPDERIPGLGGSLSSSEVLQRHLGATHVVEVFSNITFWHLASLARAAGAADRSALPIAGDDPTAKAAVTGFLRTLSGTTPWTPVRSALAARRFQFSTRAFVTPYDTFSDQQGTPCRHTAILAAHDA